MIKIDPYFCHIWVTYGIKTDTASELAHWFSTVEGFFLLPKNLLFWLPISFPCMGKPTCMVKRK